MSPKLSIEARKEAIERVIKNGESVSSVCRLYGISRVVFYKWLKWYQAKGELALAPKQGGNGSHKREYIEHQAGITPEFRKEVIDKVIFEGWPVSHVAKRYGISRIAIYKWLRRYRSLPASLREEAFLAKKRKVDRYWRQTPEQYEQAVLQVVEKHPEYGIRKLIAHLPKVGGVPIVGFHGVENILNRADLATYEKRRVYAESKRTATVRKISAIIASLTRFFLLAPVVRTRLVRFTGITALTAFVTIVVFGAGSYWVRMMTQTTGASKVGLILATNALAMGSFFFLYSMKYYLSLAIVLSSTQKAWSGREDDDAETIKSKGFLGWLFGSSQNTAGDGIRGMSGKGLNVDLSHVRLTNKPFVSVHIPFYNEKNVVERAMVAATSFNYPAYEVILLDDSTDETSGIIRRYQRRFLAKGERFHTVHGDGWSLTSVTVREGVTLKHLHRENRAGFKGAALKLALTLTDKRAAFVSVFDADFVPYPDTITQFLRYFKAQNHMSEEYGDSKIAVVQGYQWHVLNKSENWITRGVRSEYAGSYVIERSGEELYGGLKQVSGSVYMIRRDVLEKVGWHNSITEDFELTLRLYELGYKVAYTPYIQAPAECVSTLKRLVRQRMRWAEGHSNNIKRMFVRLMFGKSGNKSLLTLAEKLEFLYLSPYYLQSFFFLVGTICWFLSETIFPARLPFWTELWGWSLVLTNMLSLPLTNSVGLFLEESSERDYFGITSFVALSYILVPFQAYASLKGFLEKEEGPWFRTPKTGRITDVFERGKFYRWLEGIVQLKSEGNGGTDDEEKYLKHHTSYNTFENFFIPSRGGRKIVSLVLSVVILSTSFLTYFSFKVPVVNTRTSAYAFAELAGSHKTKGPVTMKDGISTNALYDQIDAERASMRNIVDSTFVDERAGDSFVKEAKGSNFQVFFKETAAMPGFVMFAKGDYSIQYSLADSVDFGPVNVTRAKAYLNTIVYADVFPGIDLRFTVKEDELLEEFIVADKETAARITKLSELLQPANISLKQGADGVIEFYSLDDELTFSIPKPVMYELDNVAVNNYGLHYDFEEKDTKFQLTKVIDQDGYAWFSDVNRAYPVVVDASTVDTTTNSVPTLISPERKTWWDGTYYWVAMYNGSSTEFWYSTDGTSWTENTGAAVTGQVTSVYADTTRAYYVRDKGADLAFASATSYPGTGFDWSAETVPTIFDEAAGRNFNYPFIARDTDGNIWAIAPHFDGTDIDIQVAQATNVDDITAWPAATNAFTSAGNTSNIGIVVPLNSGDVYAVFSDGGTVYGCIYDEQTDNRWENSAGSDCTSGANKDTVASSVPTGPGQFAAESDPANNDVHLVFSDTDPGTDTLDYYRWDKGTKTWQSVATLNASNNNMYYSITVDTATGDLYVAWWHSITQNIYYTMCDYSAASAECSTAGDWGSDNVLATSTSTSNTLPSLNMPTSGYVFIIWRDSTSSPYNVQFESILVPERTIWFIAAGLLIPYMLRKRKEKVRWVT